MTDTKARIPARERAARALCKVRRLPEDAMLDGAPLWKKFLPEVDAIIETLRWQEAGTDTNEEASGQ